MAEIEKTRENKFALTFTVPDEEERRKLHQVHRDRSRAEAAQADRGERGLQQFLQAIQSGAITKEELPLEIRDQLRELLG